MSKHLPIASNTNQEIPALNAIVIPHALRHGAIHGALSTRAVGESMILIAPLAEVADRAEDFEITYLVEGPDDWHIQLTRVG